MTLEPLQTHAALSIPHLYASPSHIAGPSSLATYSPSYPASSTSVSPALGLMIPGPSDSASGSLGLLSLPSPLMLESHAPSPTISDVSLMSIPSKRQRTTQSGLYCSISQLAISVSGLSPHVSVHWPTGQPWTDADQADWEVGLVQLTASAGLPL
jgi:hypothetical protein